MRGNGNWVLAIHALLSLANFAFQGWQSSGKNKYITNYLQQSARGKQTEKKALPSSRLRGADNE